MLRYTVSSKKDITLSDLQIALISYIVANQKKNNFLLTIDDIDYSEEKKENLEQDNIEILKKFAINVEQKIYRNDNLSIYQRFAAKLIEDKNAFLCFCNKKKCENRCYDLNNSEIENRLKNKLPYSVFIKESKEKIDVNDILNGRISNTVLSFKIMQNSNPTYLFANAIDDMICGVNLIIKNIKERDNSLKERYIHKLLNYNQNIEFAHIKCVKNAPTIKSLLLYGIIPDAIINYAINLIYNSKKEIFYLPDAVNFLKLDKIKDSKEFNLNELKELNKKHLELMESKKLSTIVGFSDSKIGELLKIFLKESYTVNELEIKFKKIFSAKDCNHKSIKLLSEIIKNSPYINEFNEFKNYLLKKSKIEEKKLDNLLSKLIGVKNIKEVEIIYPFIKPYILEVAKCK